VEILLLTQLNLVLDFTDGNMLEQNEGELAVLQRFLRLGKGRLEMTSKVAMTHYPVGKFAGIVKL